MKKVLNLGKKTISNLSEAEMNLHGGDISSGCHTWGCGGGKSNGCSKNANTCAGHRTCAYPCV